MISLITKLAVISVLAAPASALALDGILIVNPSVPATSLTTAALKDIYSGKTNYWEGGQAVVLVTAGDKADAALEAASGMKSSAFKTFWQRLAFSGRGQMPKTAPDPAAAVALVAATPGAGSVVPAGTAVAGVKTVEVK